MSDVLRLRVARAPQRQIYRNVLAFPPASDGFAEKRAPAVAVRKKLQKSKKKSTTSFIEQLLAAPQQARQRALSFIGSASFAGRGTALAIPIRTLDEWLAEEKNRATPSAVSAEAKRLFVTPLPSLVKSAIWRDARQQVFESLVAVFVARTEAAAGVELTRLLLIFGLLESLALSPSPIKTAGDVERALRYRTVLLPQQLLSLAPRRARLARRYGFSDLYVVRDEWSKYEAGEIAHIENVLPRESKQRSLNKLTEAEITTTVETELTEAEEHDSQTTDRMQLQQHGQRVTDLGVQVYAQVDVAASYGPMEITATAGGSFDYSEWNSEEHAFQQSHEMITRAVRRVEERVKTLRVARSLERTTERDKHQLDNKSAQPVIGIYKWVDKIQRMQLFRYPHRLLLEFEIPEPAAYLTWRRRRSGGEFLTPEPAALVRRDPMTFKELVDAGGKTQPLGPSDITEASYQWWVAQYSVAGVVPPPPVRVSVNTVLELKQQIPTGTTGGGGGSDYDVNPSTYDKSWFDLITPDGATGSPPGVTIPDGYRLESWYASGYATDVILNFAGGSSIRMLPNINVMVGSMNVNMQSTLGVDVSTLVSSNPQNLTVPSFQTWVYADGLGSANYPTTAAPVTGTVQVTALATHVRECRIQVTLDCVRMDPAALVTWQQQTYELIAAAYMALKRQRAEEEAAQGIRAGVEIKGDSPARNKEVVKEELKRGVIEMLTGVNFQGRAALQNDGTAPWTASSSTAPKVNLDNAVSVAEEIQFIEQAFEWENLTYVLYPYFWADHTRWLDLADINLPDPEFARFLRCGSARIVLPARPKFENQVVAYVDFGVVWGGGPVPTVDDPEYLSIAAEIEAQQSPPIDGEKRRSWEVRLPTTLVWLDTNNALPKANPAAILDKPPGVIVP
jgi:hypothetical protein